MCNKKLPKLDTRLLVGLVSKQLQLVQGNVSLLSSWMDGCYWSIVGCSSFVVSGNAGGKLCQSRVTAKRSMKILFVDAKLGLFPNQTLVVSLFRFAHRFHIFASLSVAERLFLLVSQSTSGSSSTAWFIISCILPLDLRITVLGFCTLYSLLYDSVVLTNLLSSSGFPSNIEMISNTSGEISLSSCLRQMGVMEVEWLIDRG